MTSSTNETSEFIRLRLHGILPEYSKSRKKEQTILYSEDLSVETILDAEGLSRELAAIVTVNEELAEMERPLKPGDEVMVFPPIAGG